VDAAVTSAAIPALVAGEILAGLKLDKVIVQLPARRLIRITAYARRLTGATTSLSTAAAFTAGVGRRRGVRPGQ
jgi:hypothetical protein